MTTPESALNNEFAQLEDDWEAASAYRSIFIDECLQTLDELTEALLALEAGGGRENIEQLFIAAHRIKGSAASIGLNRPARLAHLMEDLLQMLVYDGRLPSPKVADGLLACTDGLREYVDAMGSGCPGEDRFGALAVQLLEAKSLCDTGEHGEKAQVETESPTTEPEAEVTEAVDETTESATGISAALHQRVADHHRGHETENVLVGRVIFESDFPLIGLKARLVSSKLSNVGELHYLDPPQAELETMDEIPALCFGITTDKTAEDLKGLLRVAGVQDILIEPLAAKNAAATAPAEVATPVAATPAPAAAAPTTAAATTATTATTAAPRAAAATGGKAAETLRVDVERLDSLMNLAGQLVICKARVSQVGDKMKSIVADDKSLPILDRVAAELRRLEIASGNNTAGEVRQLDAEEVVAMTHRIRDQLETVRDEVKTFMQARGCVNSLFETIHLLDSVSDGIRQSVMDMRMLPIGPLFTRFHRVIRDITHSNGKDIRLEINGEKTELDKRMIDELGDPMIHLIRNAADHGIETPERRIAAGKPRQGTVSLDAFHRGSNIVIRVSDDGRGLNPERIREKAVEKGLISAAEAEVMTPQQLFQFIWHPGLSTAEKVTDVSGRGVGMDIVRSKIKELSGTIDVESEPGKGATFTIRLPLTLAVLPSLMVEVDRDVFCIPLESVVEIVCVRRRDMATVHGNWTVPIRDRVVAILTLNTLFNWHCRVGSASVGDAEEIMLVIIGEGDRQLGLAVNQVIGEEDVVIKSIADNYRNVTGVAGASILGDGRISLILDPPTLIEMASRPVVGTGRT